MRDLVGLIMAFEDGELTEEESIQFIADLVKEEAIHYLQGSFGRLAKRLIDEDMIDRDGNVL